MKIGLIVTNYNCADLLPRFIEPWIEFKKNNDVSIVFIDGKFEGFDGVDQNSNDGSLVILEGWVKAGIIDKLIVLDKPLKETEARTLGLGWLETQDIDYIFISAPDEAFKLQELNNIFNFVKSNPFIYSFNINYKNLTFSENQYTEGFCPSRIFKVKSNQYEIDEAYQDDNFSYKGLITRDIIRDVDLPKMVIPKKLAHVLHHTWIDSPRSHKKINYQNNRWSPPNGFGCSFKIEDGKMTWNSEYFKLTNTSIPELHNINT